MLQVLEQLSLPSRQDFAALAERFSNWKCVLMTWTRSWIVLRSRPMP